MQHHIYKMTDYSDTQLELVRSLERTCKTADSSSLRVGVESLKETGGDEAYLSLSGGQLTGFLSWYTSDGIEANINAMVHPDFRRQDIFRRLLQQAAGDMRIQGVATCRIRVPADSEPGIQATLEFGAEFATAQYTMMLNRREITEASQSAAQVHHLVIRREETRDAGFMIACLSQAFGDPEEWTRSYLAHTAAPDRITYIAESGSEPAGMIRIHYQGHALAVIHDFCVLPSQQGKGIGGQMLSAVVNLLKQQAELMVRLSVVTDNIQALKLYGNSGFEITAESHYYVIPLSRLS
ncbi:GNAT family N-acetyltransferase [Paenibacillus sp. DMB5]|uniref:GNAT family N-acetyltransferase n=1 Tax=Paenibacillus sp. DMB5 TaxID=1780103 RepID=UPI00076C3552|nr:GNAT family N-acetyltransferase [Paenibacillus sp. DMB5]KUP22288.1 hypothetical protein AWJ19_07360 [Paenibacillus sp. DMB5]